MQNLYVFTGLGADERLFKNLQFANYHVIHIKWVTPLKNETFENYASKIAEKIDSSKPIFIGLSFGGMMAIEVSKFIETEKIILISSAKEKNEIPFYYKWAGFLQLHKLVPIKALVNINIFTNWFFSNRTAAEKRLLSDILHDTDTVFLRWAIDKIVHWQNCFTPNNLIHIHGTADRILPIAFTKNVIKINGGSHLMIVNNAAEVQLLLNNELK